MSRHLPALALCSALAACLGAGLSFFGGHADQIKVPHARHAKAEVECGACHETIFDSTTLTTVDLPKEKQCLRCHGEEKEKGNCAFCHTDPEKPLTYAVRERTLKMSHAAHLELTKEDCAVCHTSLPEPLISDVVAPTMEGCLSCHEHQEQWAAGTCMACHQDLTRYPLRPVAAFSHRGDYLRQHADEARGSPAACATCHEQTFCSQCHAKTVAKSIDLLLPEQVDRAFIHRDDFLSRHPIEAQADEASCARCHGNDFCSSCHQKNGLVPGAVNGVNPHPQGFGLGPAHGAAARRDINSCAACHDQGAASNCVSCHRVGGVGGDPHPPAFSARHPREEISRNAMCQTCHQ